MANLMGILGGVGQGISGGVQDLERMDEAKFRKEQQARERAKWAEEEAAAKELAGIRRENVDTTYQGATGGIDGESATVKRSVRPQHEVLSEMASVYAKRNTPESIAKAIQFKQAARAEKESSAIDAINESFAPLEEAIRSNNLEGITKGLAAFNADQFGPTSTKGVTATPVAGPKGEMMYQVNRPGAGPLMIPQNKLGDALQAMKMDALASAAPTIYGKLNIERKAGESTADYHARIAGVQEKELGIKAPYFGALARQANANAEYIGRKPASKADQLKEEVDARASLLIETGEEKDPAKARLRAAREISKTGPKVSYQKDAEGNLVGVDSTGKIISNIGAGGLELPVGMTDSAWRKAQKAAGDANIEVEIRKNPTTGVPVVGYKGRDGQWWGTLADAQKARPAK